MFFHELRIPERAVIFAESQAGLIVQPEDTDGVANATKNLLLDPDLRREMGRRAMQYYEEHFGRDRSVSRIIKAIEAIV